MSALICGSLAYDTIMVFDGQFKNEILPDQVHILNVAFLVPQLRREFGGCAGNIAYNLKLLGGEGAPMATAGQDFAPYAQWITEQGIENQYIKLIDDSYTAQAYITTDKDDNQITAFHPGAMNEAHQQQIPANAGITLGMVSPDGRQAMIEHAEQFAAAGIPFIFDPGQGLPMFGGEELRRFIELASYVTVNDYESQMLKERTGLSEAQIAGQVEALIVTRGGEGSQIHVGTELLEIPCAPVEKVTDPTGCGDAYRAGLIYGLQKGYDWATTGRIAALMGAIKIEQPGTQNHYFDVEGFAARYQQAFGQALA
ncbi:MAG: carbohydrate kinase family protein [Nevskiales bacterium]